MHQGWNRIPLLLVAVPFVTAQPAMAQGNRGPTADGKSRSEDRRASQRPILRHVAAIEGGRLIVDVRASDRVHVGDELELWRTVKLKHPVTGATVADRFRTGTLRLVQVRERLSIVELVGSPDRAPVVGDVVIVRPPAGASNAEGVSPAGQSHTKLLINEAKPAHAEAPPPSNAEPALPSGARVVAPDDPDATAVVQLFDSLRQQPIAKRIRAYRAFAKKHPKNRFSGNLLDQAALMQHAIVRDREAHDEQPEVIVYGDAPEEALAGQGLTVAVHATNIEGAVLHHRPSRGEPYVTAPMANIGNDYYSARVPGSSVGVEGLQLAVVGVHQSGHKHSLVASAGAPATINVRQRSGSASPPYRFEAQLSTDYADWNQLKGNDYAWQTEGQVGARMRDIGLRAIRSGFGVYRGVGGSLDELDNLRLPARSIGLTYGYLEGEVGVSHFVGLIGRGAIGLLDDGVSGGGQLFLRLGNDLESNLVLGAELLGGVGVRGIASLNLNALARFPMMFRTEVSNQPAGTRGDGLDAEALAAAGERPLAQGTSDVGARAIAQVGFRATEALTLSLRGSYQGRTIRHAGPGVGGAVSYQW